MIQIAHRGNINGPNPQRENSPDYILEAIEQGFDVEVDVWCIDGKLFLGHDEPQYETDDDFLNWHRGSLWIHCKNLEAMEYFAEHWRQFNFFWHQNDDYTLTSYGNIWTYPGKPVNKWSVIVDLEGKTEYNCYAICSDYFAKEK